MKLIDIYNTYKEQYPSYILFIKSGIFYETFEEDTSIMFNLYKYKIKNMGKYYEIGFPAKNILSITDKLKKKKVNYIILDKDNSDYVVIEKYRVNNNCYEDYICDHKKIFYTSLRINNIAEKLYDKVIDNNIDKTLEEIEKLI